MKAHFRAISVHSETAGTTSTTSEVVSFSAVAEVGQVNPASKKATVAGTFALTLTDPSTFGFFVPGTDYEFGFTAASKSVPATTPAPATVPVTPAAPPAHVAARPAAPARPAVHPVAKAS